MSALAKSLGALAVLCALVALFWLILPFWQVAAGMADGFMPFLFCGFIGVVFGVIDVGLWFCFWRARSGEISSGVKTALWSFVAVSGAIISAMALRILYGIFVPQV